MLENIDILGMDYENLTCVYEYCVKIQLITLQMKRNEHYWS